jgi:hypothetical protein
VHGGVGSGHGTIVRVEMTRMFRQSEDTARP